MIKILYPGECPDDFVARLKQLGFPAHTFTAGEVTELTTETAEVVYVLPHQAMSLDSWPRLRVQLAQANRLYIAVIEKASTAEVARFLRDGAYDVLAMEDNDTRWREALMTASGNQQLWIQLYGGRPLSSEDILSGRSESILRLRQTIDRLGPTDVCVLIQGESGVGKERIASALHKAGHGKSFVALNCAAIPKDLLESELFGVEKGAFTGAMRARAGLVEQAQGGTLFLDEIGEMDISVQPKLLRFLETRCARRVGGEKEYQVKLRVISATNRNLDTEIAEKRFRADLFYRLAEITLHAPPLRTRPEDVPELALNFMRKANERFGKNFETIEPAMIEKFQLHTWPGNVRELKSTVDRLVLLFDGSILRAPWWDVPETRVPQATGFASMPVMEASSVSTQSSPAVPIPEAVHAAPVTSALGVYTHGMGIPNHKQKLVIARRLMEESGNNFSWVAGQLGINVTTLWRWRKTGKLG
ncbi:MAG: sigma-54 dependent transcriptional regulator [Verrucomicrobiota bacterium]